MSEKERLQNFKQSYDALIGETKRYITHDSVSSLLFREYIQKRDEQNIILDRLQNDIIHDVKQLLSIKTIYPASSFTARMNLISDSDLDFVIVVDKLSDEYFHSIKCKLDTCGFVLKESRFLDDKERFYHVFSKSINYNGLTVDVELKLREEKYFEKMVHPIHKYLEQCSTEDKNIITWIKYNLKQSNDAYVAFKTIFHENALANLNSNRLLMTVN